MSSRVYRDNELNRVAFPLGGIGAGMICLEGTGSLSHLSVRHKPEVFNEPVIFAAVTSGSGSEAAARVLEGPVPGWKVFGSPGTGNGARGTTYGLPRFREAEFSSSFPFARCFLKDADLPVAAEITGWSPFIPGDPDNSSLPMAVLEYSLTNTGAAPLPVMFSMHAENFMKAGDGPNRVRKTADGFILEQDGTADAPEHGGAFSFSLSGHRTITDTAWFRGGWFDPLTMIWRTVTNGTAESKGDVTSGDPSPGGSLSVSAELGPGETTVLPVIMTWYVPESNLTAGEPAAGCRGTDRGGYKPFYISMFSSIEETGAYCKKHMESLRRKSLAFSECFFDTDLPGEVTEAVEANLTILKSPTVLRQADGRLWCWEGCCDERGCCYGSCTHVWNYAQALPHLFPSLERSLRETEFGPSQNDEGHQNMRTALPIAEAVHNFHAASDGQLGGIMKAYREWRISGDTKWLRRIWPRVKQSLAYCIKTWDPDHTGVLSEPHHNTYDIEFWGPDGMCTSFYLGALQAASRMAVTVGEDHSLYDGLYQKGLRYLEENLFNGEYFFQDIQVENLHAPNPLEDKKTLGSYSPEARDLFLKEGPKYQYGTGCLSDGIIGVWMSRVCGLDGFGDREKVRSHLKSVYRYNYRDDLHAHANPQRPGYALGSEGGLLLCTWPKGNGLSLPFPYSNEVWTGIEYQAAAHLIMEGFIEEGLDIVKTLRRRYDGTIRNPYNEYECGHWYARAMASYSLLQAFSGARYDAVEQVLYLEPVLTGDFRVFLSAAGGYGTAGIRNGEPFLDVKSGEIPVKEIRLQRR
ncbi:MAG: GH116 family glycosyl hydrolase [Spirochaetia bacterium]